MRVLLASIAHFCDLQGGSQRIVQDEAAELRSRGCDVWVVAPGAGEQPEYELRNGIHLLRYVTGKTAAWNPARRSIHQKAAAAVLAEHLPRVDAIHGHAPLPYLAALDLYGSSVHSCYTIHSPAKLEMAVVWKNAGPLRRAAAAAGLPAINRMERECLRRSKIISALSQYTIECIKRLHGHALAARIRLLPGWVETSSYVPLEDRNQAKIQLGWPGDVPILFTLRRLVPRMGLDRLLQACGQLRAQHIRFHLMIGGNGPLRNKLEQQSRSLGLTEVVSFLGKVDQAALPIAYAACDAFVLPTAELECFGLIALEALAAGRPVLATPVGALPEILTKFEPAWLARSAEPADIFDLLRRYIAGLLPMHDPSELHERADREYGQRWQLPAFVDATVCNSSC